MLFLISLENHNFGIEYGESAMSRRTLNSIVVIVIASLLAYVVLGVALVHYQAEQHWLDLYKALVSLVIAVPAAVLAAAFQRRTSYLGSLRDLWKQLIPAAQEAIQYTHLETAEQAQFARVQLMLSTAIDSLRGVFKNVHHPKVPAGLYPFDNLKDIQQIIAWLGFGKQFKRDQRIVARRCITLLWQEMHADLLSEFDREEPTKPAGKYLHTGRSIADDLIDGLLTDECLQACSKRQRLPSQGCRDKKPQTPAAPRAVPDPARDAVSGSSQPDAPRAAPDPALNASFGNSQPDALGPGTRA